MEVGKTLLIGNFLDHEGSDDSEDSKKEQNTLKKGNTTNILCPFTIRKSTNFPNSLAFIKNSNMNSKGSWGLYKNSIESSGESNNSKEKIPTMDPQPKPSEININKKKFSVGISEITFTPIPKKFTVPVDKGIIPIEDDKEIFVEKNKEVVSVKDDKEVSVEENKEIFIENKEVIPDRKSVV